MPEETKETPKDAKVLEMPKTEPEKPTVPVKKEPPKTEVILDVADGSSIQIAHLTLQNQVAQVHKASMEVQVHEANASAAKERVQKAQMLMQEAQRLLAEKLEKFGIPDGWNWERLPDGGYRFMKPKPQAPGMPMPRP